MAHNHPQRVYVVRTPSELVTQIEKMPPLLQEVKMEERCVSTYRSSQRISPFTNSTSSDQIQQPSESPKVPSSILSLNSLHIDFYSTTNTTETAGPKIEDTTEKVDLYHDTTYGSDKSASATLAHRLNRKEADNQVLAPGYSQTTPEDKNGHQVNPRVNPAQKKEKKVGISKEKRIILVTRRIKSEV